MEILIKKSSRPIPLGRDISDDTDLELAPERLPHHVHLIGPTGSGKSRLLFRIFQQLCATGQPIVGVDFKGGLYRMARDWALTHGHTKRLVLFDLSAEMLPGYNPLRENGLRIDLQAQWAAEGIKSAWGQATFDQTPQLARYIYMCLYVARALHLSLLESLDVLRPDPALRYRALSVVKDSFMRGELLAFDTDKLSPNRKEELTRSTINRLTVFCRDMIVRKVICSPRSLDLETLLSERKIILVNFGRYQPLLPEPMKVLARLFMSDLLAHVYKGYGEGRFNEHRPVYFLCDEIQNMATRQLCDVLDEGRGIGLHCVLAHQHLSQLRQEDESGYLFHSMMNDARAKIVFGGLAPDDLDVLAKYVMLHRYNPWPTPDQIGKTARLVVNTTTTHSTGKATAWPTSETEGESASTSIGINRSATHGTQESTSEAHTTGRSRGRSLTHGEAHTTTRGSAHTTSQGYARTSMHSSSRMSGRGDAHGTMDAASSGTMAAQRPSPTTHTAENSFTADGMSHSEGETTSVNDAHTLSESRADTFSLSEGIHESDSETFTKGRSKGSSSAETRGDSHTTTSGTTVSHTNGVTPSESEEWGESIAKTIQALSPEEQHWLAMQYLYKIPNLHVALILPDALYSVQVRWVDEPRITRSQLQAGIARVNAQPFYTHRDASVIDGEAQEILTPQQTISPRLSDPEHTSPAASTPPVGPTTFRRKRRRSET